MYPKLLSGGALFFARTSGVHWRLCFALDLPPMKLTIIRLQHFSDQDRIDLGKIWPSQDLSTLTLDENHRLYARRDDGFHQGSASTDPATARFSPDQCDPDR